MLASSETISSSPITVPCASPPTWLSPSALRMVATGTSAHSTPVSRPRPPKTLMPPSSAMVMTSSSKPTALLARAFDSRAVKTMPATAQTIPETTNSQKRIRRSLIPE